MPLPLRKGAGFTFSNNQLIEFASNMAGRPLKRVSAMSRMLAVPRRDGIGRLFYHIYLPDGMDDDKDEDNKRRWTLFFVIKDLDPGETVIKFSDIPFDESDPEIAKGLKWLVEYGCSEDDVKARWATFSSWSVGRTAPTSFNL